MSEWQDDLIAEMLAALKAVQHASSDDFCDGSSEMWEKVSAAIARADEAVGRKG